jgi:hypothetical protein
MELFWWLQMVDEARNSGEPCLGVVPDDEPIREVTFEKCPQARQTGADYSSIHFNNTISFRLGILLSKWLGH